MYVYVIVCVCAWWKKSHGFHLEYSSSSSQAAQGRNAVCMAAGVGACCRVGRLGEAEQVLHWARRHQIRVGRGAFNRLIKLHAERGDMQRAMHTYKWMTQQGYVADG
jgi:hypothetical protein